MDRYLVHGHEYKALREAVGKAILEGKPQAIMTALKVGRAQGSSLQRDSPQNMRLLVYVKGGSARDPRGDILRRKYTDRCPWPPLACPARPGEQQ